MLPSQTTTPPAQPAPPSPRVGVKVGETTIPVDASVRTAADVRALRARRAELSNQLTSVTNRRESLVRDLQQNRVPDGVARSGIEQRLAVLDQRIVELEQQLAETGRQLTTASPGLLEQSQAMAAPAWGPFSSGQLTAIAIVGMSTIGLPLAGAAAWLMIKRAQRPRPTPQSIESVERLTRLEQAVDAVAIEVERISEGQRFVTRVLASGTRDADRVQGETPNAHP